jgi:hypothetical protein
MNKQCITCGETKDISYFPFRKEIGKYRGNCKICYNEKRKQWKKSNDYDRAQYEKHKDKKLAGVQAYRNNPENKSKIRECQNKWRIKRKKENPQYRLECNMRRRCLLALNGKYKHATTFKLIGCSTEELKEHIESLWTDGMSWENYGVGGWHIDHARPVSSFDLTKEEEQKAAFHYSNLQPLWQKDNLLKGAKIVSNTNPTTYDDDGAEDS